MVKDIRPGGSGSYPQHLVNVNGTIFFSADGGVSGYELWKSDGTAEGIVSVKDAWLGSPGSFPQGLVNVHGMLFFPAYDLVNGVELWKSDGTDSGPILVKNLNPGSMNSSPQSLVEAGTVAIAPLSYNGWDFNNPTVEL